MRLGTFLYKLFCEHIFSISLDNYLGVELLSPRVYKCLDLSKTVRFSQTPTNSVWEFQLLQGELDILVPQIIYLFCFSFETSHQTNSVSFLMSMDTFSEGTLEIITWLVEFLCLQDFSLLCSSVLTMCWPWLKYFSQILDLSIKFLDFWLPFTWSSTSKACLTAHTVAAADPQDLVCTMKLDRSLQLSQTSSPLPADSRLKTIAWSATTQRDFFFTSSI